MDTESTSAFIDCILAYSKNLESNTVSEDLEDLFFRLAEDRDCLPESSSVTVIDAFLAICVHMITLNQGDFSNRALKLLFIYLKNDQQVFNRFKVNRLIVRKMKLVDYMFSQNQDISDLTLDFTSFLLRYNRELDYQDFSDDPQIVQKIKKFETYRTWSDIEDLASCLNQLQQAQQDQQNTMKNAFQEMYQHIEKFKQEESAKKNDFTKDLQKLQQDQQKLKEYQQPQPQLQASQPNSKLQQLAQIDMINEVKTSLNRLFENKITDLEFNLNNRLITRIETIEKNSELHLRTAQTLENRYTIDSKRMEKLEETMNDQISIIESMNRRQKSFMESQDELKNNIMLRIQRLENDFIAKTFEALDQKFDFKHFDQSVKKIQGDLDVFRVDHLTFKEIASTKLDSIDIIFKKVANDTFNKVREVEQELNIIKEEFLKFTEENIKDNANFYEKIEILGNEIIEIKNEKKAMSNLKQKIHWASDATAKVEALVEETNNLYNYFQKFIDEHAVDRVKLLKSQEANLKEKMNVMDWLARNSEYLSAVPIKDCISAFKDLYNTENATLKNAYIFAKHSSHAIQTIVEIMENTLKQARDDDVQQKITVLFSILEPLLINDQNLEKALQMNGVKLLLLYLDSSNIKDKPPIYVKYCIRCLTSCLRQEIGVSTALINDEYIEKMIEILRVVRDEEILANASKCLRICMRDDQNLEYIVSKRKDIGNILIETLKIHEYSEAISQELLSALRNFTKKQELIILIFFENLKILILIARSAKNDKIKSLAIQVLKNCSKVADYERYIASENAIDLSLGINNSNNKML